MNLNVQVLQLEEKVSKLIADFSEMGLTVSQIKQLMEDAEEKLTAPPKQQASTSRK